MKEGVFLIDGKTYQFKLNGQTCSGVFVLGDDEREGGFYCNGSAVCSASDASQIERLYTKADLDSSAGAMINKLNACMAKS